MSISRFEFGGVVAEYVAAFNAFDEDAVVATFADDALVNDVRREFWGKDAIRGWVREEIVGDRVTVEPIDVFEHHGQTIVRGRYDGEYDKTNLPDELILTSYFAVEDGRIVTLIVIHNAQPATTTG
jgi:limonene-1,2-epoxide hydrolase